MCATAAGSLPQISIAAHSGTERGDHPLDLVLDGDVTGVENYAVLGPPPQWVTLELSPPTRVERIGIVYLGHFGGRDDYRARWRVEVSTDGERWATVAEEKQWRHEAVYEGAAYEGIRFVRATVTAIQHDFDQGVYLRELWVNQRNPPGRIGRLNQLDHSQHYRHFETELVGPHGAMLVLPEDPQQRVVAEELQRKLAARGVRLPVLDSGSEPTEALRDRNLIAIGNLSTNRFVERLYREYYCFVDRWYPGDGGYVVQTIHDPYGTGRNVVLLGASDAVGLRRAVERFLDLLSDNSFLPRTFEVELGAKLKALRKRRGDGPRSLVLPWRQSVFGGDNRAGYEYLFTGDESAAEEYKKIMLDPATQFDHLTFFHKIVQWDLLEECPVFSEEDRRRITERILEVLLSGEGAGNGGFREAMSREEPRQNHQTRVALIMFFGGRYFRKYFRLPQCEQWLAEVERFFGPQMKCSKTMCDDNADQWQGAIDNTAIYAFASGHTEFFDNGMMRLAADRAVANCNNLGEMVPLGDAWDTYYPVTVLSKAAYYYRDGLYQAWLERRDPLAPRVPTDDPLRSFCIDLHPEKAKDWIGFTRAPLQPLYYHFVGGQHPAVPLKSAFDKIAFRSGLDSGALYFLLDGASGGSHSYDDANSLIEVSQYDRVYLTTLDNQTGPTYADHNAITVTRDGTGARPPALAEVEAMKTTGKWAHTRTTVRDYNGADWTRHIWARADRFLLVADQLTARTDGDFVFIARWRTLGEPRLVEANARVTSRGSHEAVGATFSAVQAPRDGSPGRRDTFVIQTLPGATVRFQVDTLATGKEPLLHYPYAPMAVNVLRQILGKRLRAGESVTFWNLLHATPGGDPDPAKTLLAAPEGVVVEGWGAPLFFNLDTEKPVSASTQCETPPTPSNQWQSTPIEPLREVWRISAPTPVLAMHAWTETGGSPRVVVSMQGGEIIVVNDRGEVEWRHETGDPVHTVDAADVDNDGCIEILAGSDDGHVYLFDRWGKLRWAFAPPFRDTGFNWWTLGSSKVRRVLAADLDGDGHAEILAGVGNMYLHVLDAQGKQKWEFMTRYGVFSNFTTVDYNDDGNLKIVGGTNGLSCVSDCAVINAEGQQMATLANDGWVSSLSALLVTKGQEGSHLIVCGTDMGNLRAFAAPEGRLLWQRNIGDGVTALAVRGAAGGRDSGTAWEAVSSPILAASESCNVSAFGFDGTRLWHTRLPDSVTCLLALSGGRAIAGDASEGLWWLGEEGRIIGRWPVEGGVAEIQQVGHSGLLVRSGRGEVVLLRATE